MRLVSSPHWGNRPQVVFSTINADIHNSALSALLPANGGLGIRALTWSPDGKSLAVLVSLGATGLIEVVNAQTGTLSYTLPIADNYVATTLVWSPDGKYIISGEVNNTAGTQDMVAHVWSA